MYNVWALGNLVLSLLGVLLSIAALTILLVFLSLGYKRQSIVFPSITFVIGAAGILIFIFSSNIRLPMVMVDYWTILHLLIYASQVILMILALVQIPKYKQPPLQQYFPVQHPYYQQQFPHPPYTEVNKWSKK